MTTNVKQRDDITQEVNVNNPLQRQVDGVARDMRTSNEFILAHSAGVEQGIRMYERGDIDEMTEDPGKVTEKLRTVVSRTEKLVARMLGIGKSDHGRRLRISSIIQEGIVKGATMMHDYS